MDLLFLLDTLRQLLGGLPLTLNLAAMSLAIGAVGAVGLALATSREHSLAGSLARGYVFVFRGTPLLIQIFLIYYGLGQFRPTLQELGLWTLFRSPFWCAVLALALNTAAYGSEILRGAIAAVPRGAVEAAQACGMTRVMQLRRVVLPLALRLALPAYGNELVLMVKATSLASVITLMEVTGLAGKLIAQTYRSLEVFACAGLIYLTLNFILTWAVQTLERRFARERAHAH